MFLQEWIHNRIRQAPEYGGHIGDELTRKDVEDFQFFQLRRILSYVYQKSAFYRGLFSKAGIKPDDVFGFDDLAKIPFTTPADLTQSPYKLLCISLAEVQRAYTLATSGTTGAPKKVFFSEGELQGLCDYMGAAMKTVAMLGGIGSSGYKVLILLPDGKPESQLSLLARGVERHDGVPIRGDISLNTMEQIEVIKRTKSDIIFGSVSRLWRTTQEARQANELWKMGVKIIFLTSEYLPNAIRQRLRELWGADVYLHYGMTEMGFGGAIECHIHEGFHFNEADFLFEVVDPITGKVLKDGKEGELVFTTLNREGMPLIRYKTGDLTSLIGTSCDCGASTLKRVARLAKRIGSVIEIGEGEEIYPALFDDVLYQIPSLIDYRVWLAKEEGKGCITCKAEVTGEDVTAEEEVFEAISNIPPIKKAIEANWLAGPQIELVERGTLKRVGRAKQRIIDNRS